MAKGDVRHAGRRRKAPNGERVAKRVRAFCECDESAAPEGVLPLNNGFFQLERMRQETVATAKVRAKKRGKVRGK